VIEVSLSKGPNRVGVSHPLHLRTEADPASKNIVILDFWIMDKVQKPISSQCYISLSEHFRMQKIFGYTFQPEVLFVVPSLLLFLASHPAVTKAHLSSVENVVCGAAPATKNLIDKFKAKLDRDVNIRQG
jgi:hypothetical protein